MSDEYFMPLVLAELALICVQLGLIANHLADIVEKMP